MYCMQGFYHIAQHLKQIVSSYRATAHFCKLFQINPIDIFHNNVGCPMPVKEIPYRYNSRHQIKFGQVFRLFNIALQTTDISILRLLCISGKNIHTVAAVLRRSGRTSISCCNSPWKIFFNTYTPALIKIPPYIGDAKAARPKHPADKIFPIQYLIKRHAVLRLLISVQ